MAQTLSQIKALLAVHGIHPNRRLGQNFLHDANQIRHILTAADIKRGDLILEVGPGTGTLSECLIEAGATVVAVEIDRRLAQLLDQRLSDHKHFTLIHADVMAGKHAINPDVLSALAGTSTGASTSFKLVANLPYSIASPLLATLMMDHPAMTEAIVMIQKEVADRITAKPGNKEYGSLGIILQAMCEIYSVATLSPNCFWPKPKIDSAVLRLVRRDAPLTDDPHALSDICQKLFTQRRKQIGSILGRDFTLPDDVNPKMRPEQLTVTQIIAIAAMKG